MDEESALLSRRQLLRNSSQGATAVVISGAVAALAGLTTSGGTMAATSSITDAQREHNVGVARRFFELLNRKDVDAWAALWAEDGRIIVPYPPEGFGTSIDGKAAILAAFRDLFSNFETFDADLTAIYPAADSDAVCVEYNVRATIVGGVEYTNTNIVVFRFEDGLISAYHDYFDPRRFQTVVDALPKR